MNTWNTFGLTATILFTFVPGLPAQVPTTPTELKLIEADPGTYLGQRLTIRGILGTASKPLGTGSELSVWIDAKTASNRLRFLAARSLADATAQFREPQPVLLVGTLMAAQSVRTGYTFEVESITLLDQSGSVVKTLKPAEGAPLPIYDPVDKKEAVPDKVKLPRNPDGTGNDGMTKALAIGAGLMALLLTVLGVVGLRLLKHLKTAPKNRARGPAIKIASGG